MAITDIISEEFETRAPNLEVAQGGPEDFMSEDEMDAEIWEVVLLDSEGTRRSFAHFAQRPRADLRFGMDAAGEIYLLSKANGSIWMISSASDGSLEGARR